MVQQYKYKVRLESKSKLWLNGTARFIVSRHKYLITAKLAKFLYSKLSFFYYPNSYSGKERFWVEKINYRN